MGLRRDEKPITKTFAMDNHHGFSPSLLGSRLLTQHEELLPPCVSRRRMGITSGEAPSSMIQPKRGPANQDLR